MGQDEQAGPSERSFAAERETMVNRIELMYIRDQNVLAAMRAVPRHRFVPLQYRDYAYANQALPLAYGQTISQPYIVAFMTELLELQKTDKVLEIGTGSGYQAAILAQIATDIYTIDSIRSLADQARDTLAALGYQNIQAKVGDGYFGWPESGPFQAIIVTAAATYIPPPLLQQLDDGGRLVIPLGPPGAEQTLWKAVKRRDAVTMEEYGSVFFVPFTRD